MFERYTQKARRVIFFARYEASQFGSPYIETEHLLLGLLREDLYLREHTSVAAIREEIETKLPKKSPITVEPELSEECKGVLRYANKEAEGSKQIETEHMLLGLLSEKSFVSEILWNHLERDTAQKKLRNFLEIRMAIDAGKIPDPLAMTPEERRKVTRENIHNAKTNFQSVEGVLEEFFDSLEWATNRARFRLSSLRKKYPGEGVGNA